MKDRVYHNFEVNDLNIFKNKMLNWMNQFSISCFLDNNAYFSQHSKAEWILGVTNSNQYSFKLSTFYCFDDLKSLHNKYHDWFLGHFNFNANHDDKRLHPVNFPTAHFFIPDYLIILKNNILTVGSISNDPITVFQEIMHFEKKNESFQTQSIVDIQCIESKEEFIQTINTIQEHIQKGDCYEMNYCTAFFSENTCIHPLNFFIALSENNPSPFAAYYRYFDQYLISASPERFLQKEGQVLRSQPIKGTIKRNEDKEIDEIQQKKLINSAKDQAENVMIVDLVRNDLSKICIPGTVKVEELMKLYSFPFVHQLISTITGELDQTHDFASAIKNCYPMGSMTGAPKKKVLELTQKFEKQPRGIFSGSIGYIKPNADFDFNVVIRSAIYNAQTKFLCFPAGAGITIYSVAKDEWDECLLKIENIKKMLDPNGTSIE